MPNQTARTFLETFLHDTAMQQQLKAVILADGMLTFAHWQQIATRHGWRFSEANFEAVLIAAPALIAALEAVAAEWGVVLQPDLEFELSEDELATVSGGSRIDAFQGQERLGWIPLLKI